MKKVAICVPSYGDWRAEFGMSFAHMVAQTLMSSNRLNVSLNYKQGTLICTARHQFAVEALRAGADYILWIDSDMTFPPDTLLRLLSHEKDFVGCAYTSRRLPRLTACESKGGIFDPNFPGLVEVERIGFGLVLTSTALFKAIDPPWFELPWMNKDGMDYEEAEDTNFCRKVKDSGHQIWIDAPLSREVGHVGTFTYTLNFEGDAERVKQQTRQ